MASSAEQPHSHCNACVQMFCNHERLSSCEMISCELNCGACFHACKLEEHSVLCLNKWIDCVNSGYGCPLTMPRWQMMNHIKRCPASVVHCTREWNRRFAASNIQFQLPEYSSREVHTSQLDIALAVRDQQVLMQYRKDAQVLKASSESSLPSSPSLSSSKKLSNCFYDIKCSHCERRKARFDIRHRQPQSHGQETENGESIACTDKTTLKESRTDNERNSGGSDKEVCKKEILHLEKVSAGPLKDNMHSFEQPTHVSQTVADHQVTVDITLESMPRYQRKPDYMHTFLCAKDFRRDEINNHIQNVHSEIHAGLNGWLEQRCPLAQYGCTFSQHRFHPDKIGTRIIYSQELESFGVKPKPVSTQASADDGDCGHIKYDLTGTDYISHLPLELLRHIVRMLDSFSISSLSLASHLFRQVCCSLLEERGIVVPRWIKKNGAWEIKTMVWHFSTSFTGITSWKFEEAHIMSEHLKSCTYNIRLPVTNKPVKVINITGSNPIPLSDPELDMNVDVN